MFIIKKFTGYFKIILLFLLIVLGSAEIFTAGNLHLRFFDIITLLSIPFVIISLSKFEIKLSNAGLFLALLYFYSYLIFSLIFHEFNFLGLAYFFRFFQVLILSYCFINFFPFSSKNLFFIFIILNIKFYLDYYVYDPSESHLLVEALCFLGSYLILNGNLGKLYDGCIFLLSILLIVFWDVKTYIFYIIFFYCYNLLINLKINKFIKNSLFIISIFFIAIAIHIDLFSPLSLRFAGASNVGNYIISNYNSLLESSASLTWFLDKDQIDYDLSFARKSIRYLIFIATFYEDPSLFFFGAGLGFHNLIATESSFLHLLTELGIFGLLLMANTIYKLSNFNISIVILLFLFSLFNALFFWEFILIFCLCMQHSYNKNSH